MTDKHLRPVPDAPADGPEGKTEASAQPKAAPVFATLEDAVDKGRAIDVLRAQQRDVARLLDEGAGAQTAQLHRTLTALTKEIQEHEELIGVQTRPRTPDAQFEAG